MAADDAGFTTELRGYKKDEVDQTVGALRRDLIKANSDRTEALKEVKRLQALAEDLQAELDEVGSPTYAGLGTKLENTLRVAEEQSTRLIAQADIDAEKLRASVQQEVDAQRSDAAETAERLVEDAQAQADRILTGAREEADAIVSRATADAEATTQEAMREAAAIRGAVATEVAETRAAGRREVASLRAEAEREVAELRFGVAEEGAGHDALADKVADLGERVEVLPDRLLVYSDDGEEVVAKVHERGLRPVATLVRRSSLEDVFLRLTGRTLVD